jgi:hypothetical protein
MSTLLHVQWRGASWRCAALVPTILGTRQLLSQANSTSEATIMNVICKKSVIVE